MFFKKRKFSCIIIFTCIFLISCLTTHVPEEKKISKEEKNYIKLGNDNKNTPSLEFEIQDIQPVELTFKTFVLQSSKSPNTDEYVSSFNHAVEYINSGDFNKAIDIFKKLIYEYDDHGQALFNTGYCYYKINDFENALTYAIFASSSGYKESDDFIDNMIFQIGYNHLLHKEYKEAIGYFKNCLINDVVSQNILFSYLELSKELTFPGNAIMLLYAGNYMKTNKVNNENVMAIANELGVLLTINPTQQYFENAINIIHYSLAIKEDLYLRKSLALLYMYMQENQKAEQEFLSITKNSKKDKELLSFVQERLIELQGVKYKYKKECPVQIKLQSGGVQEKQIEFKFSIPQENSNQTVIDLNVTLNNKPLEYEILHDQAKARFIKVEVGELVRNGNNKFIIQAVIERKAQRFSEEELQDLKVKDYDKSGPLYKYFTKSTDIYLLTHPDVLKAREELDHIKNDTVIEITKAVYKYVIAKMRYEMYEMGERSKEDILDRLPKVNYSGVCEDYSVFTVTLLRSYGIPSLVISGPYFNSEIGHAWPAFFTPGFTEHIVIDTTWGDTSEMHDYYFLFNSNLTVIENFGWDSDIIPGGFSSYFYASSNFKVTLKSESITLEKIE